MAADEFRQHGIVTSGIADVMAAVGLTHGGFYRHFESKEQLVAEATAAALDTLLDTLASAASGNSSCLGLLGSPHETESIPLTEYCRVFLGQRRSAITLRMLSQSLSAATPA